MSAFSHAAAVRRLHHAMLGRGSRRLADYWLTLWRDDGLPLWPDFDMAAVRDLTSGLVAFELRPDETLMCLLCGDTVRGITGMDLTGKDWLALASPDQRPKRLEGYGTIASGAVGICLRYGQHRSGGVHFIEEILLPFAPLPTGARPVLAHIGWRPLERGHEVPEFSNSLSIPDEIELIPLHP